MLKRCAGVLPSEPWVGTGVTMESGAKTHDVIRANRLFTARAAAIAALIALALMSARRSSFAAEQGRPCSASSYHELDFWIGDWDVFDVTSPTKQVARVHVDSILNGCVLREDYQATDGHGGESFSIFDATRQVWHQTWVTDHGRLLMIEGGMRDGAMVLEGADRTSDGRDRQVRGIWKRGADGVHERALTSLDGGKTWTQWFDLVFRAHGK
jgi:hypothetical protein